MRPGTSKSMETPRRPPTAPSILLIVALLLSGCTSSTEHSAPGAAEPNPSSPHAGTPFDLTVIVEGVGNTTQPLAGASVQINGGRAGTGTVQTDDNGAATFTLERGQIIDVHVTKPEWASIAGPSFAIDIKSDDSVGEAVVDGLACAFTVVACFFVFDDGPPNLVAAGATFRFHMAPQEITRTWTATVPLTIDPANQQTDWHPASVMLAEDQTTHDFYRYWTTQVDATMTWSDTPQAAAALELGIACTDEGWAEATGDDSFAAPTMQGGSREISFVPESDGFLFFEGGPLECPAFQVGPIARSSTGEVAAQGTLVAHLDAGFQRPDVTLHP